MVARDTDGAFLCLGEHEDAPLCCGEPKHIAIRRRVEANDEMQPRRLGMGGVDDVALGLWNLILKLAKPERNVTHAALLVSENECRAQMQTRHCKLRSERNFVFGEVVGARRPSPDDRSLVSRIQAPRLDVLDLVSSAHQAAGLGFAKIQCRAQGHHVRNSRALDQPDC
jgi:hypothetical protein